MPYLKFSVRADQAYAIVTFGEGVFVDAQPKVIVIDDDVAFLDSMRSLLKSMGLFAECYITGDAFLEAYREGVAGCIILDLKLAHTDGFHILDALSRIAGAPPVIVMTAHADPPAVVRAYRYGIVAFLEKQSFSESALWDGIQQSFALDATRRKKNARRLEVNSRLARLTPGERSVLNLVINGKDHGSIAESLKIGRRAVENRMSRVREKLGVGTIPELVRLMAEAEEADDHDRP